MVEVVAKALFAPSSSSSSDSDDFEILAQDADTEESDAPTDPELGCADYWTCIKCKNQKNNPMYRFCEKCYQVNNYRQLILLLLAPTTSTSHHTSTETNAFSYIFHLHSVESAKKKFIEWKKKSTKIKIKVKDKVIKKENKIFSFGWWAYFANNICFLIVIFH